MAGNNNKKYLFRQPALDPEVDQQEFLPRDIADWFDPYRTSGRGPGANGATIDGVFVDSPDSRNGFPGGYSNEGSQEQLPPYYPNPPGLTAAQPQILAVVNQQVVQDPQGATVTVTFDIGPDQDNMRYELRLTKA